MSHDEGDEFPLGDARPSRSVLIRDGGGQIVYQSVDSVNVAKQLCKDQDRTNSRVHAIQSEYDAVMKEIREANLSGKRRWQTQICFNEMWNACGREGLDVHLSNKKTGSLEHVVTWGGNHIYC